MSHSAFMEQHPSGVIIAAPDARANAKAYADAMRHSTRVRFFKRAIPLGSALSIGMVLVISIFDPFGRLGGLDLGPIHLNGTKITMEQPKLSGFRKDARPYEVIAVSATQDVKKPNIVELKDLKARITLEGTNVARLEASSGIYDTEKEKLQLIDNVRVKSDSGYDAKLKSAQVDFKAGSVVSHDAVQVALTGGTVEADTLDIRDNGKVIVFEGRVHAVLDADRPLAGPNAGQRPGSPAAGASPQGTR
jgi:lipopolysaccharide export system protein LptC